MNDKNRNGLIVLCAALLIGGGAGWVAKRSGVVPAGVGPASVASKAPVTRSEHPNVLVILWDTTRADHLSLYGHDEQTTPNMAKWAENAVVFEQAISPAMWTVPSHASMFTGVMPTTHNADYDYRWLDGTNRTLAEWLGESGYDTYAFSANPNLADKRYNLLQGVDTVEMSWKGQWTKRVGAETRKKLIQRDRSTEISPGYAGKKGGPFSNNAAPFTGKALTTWIDQRPDPGKPWFAYLNYMEAHKPRVPTLEARRRIADSPESIELGLSTDLSLENQLLYSVGAREYTPAELSAIEDVYDASLTELDDWTGKLIEDLRQRGELENTIIVFTSDHGENLGDHHLFGHRHGLYQALVHVPLVIAWEGHLEGRRVAEPTSNADLYWTITRLAGLPPPESPQPGYRTDLLAGTSEAVFTEAIGIDREGIEMVKRAVVDPTRFEHRFKAVVQAGWKLIETDAGVKELYHLAIDPDELTDLSASEPARLAELDAALDRWAAAQPAYDPTGQTASDVPVEDDEATKAMLTVMGYIPEEDEEAPADGTAVASAAPAPTDVCHGLPPATASDCRQRLAACDGFAEPKRSECIKPIAGKANKLRDRGKSR